MCLTGPPVLVSLSRGRLSSVCPGCAIKIHYIAEHQTPGTLEGSGRLLLGKRNKGTVADTVALPRDRFFFPLYF